MNQPSAAEQTSLAAIESADPTSAGLVQLLVTSAAHQMLTLIGLTFFLFEIAFVVFYSDNFWFSFNLAWAGVPAVVMAALIAHGFLLALESDVTSRLASFLWNGKPLIVYRKWLKVNKHGVTFGIRHVQWCVIDELSLTYMGTLEVKSRVVCGADAAVADVLLRIPFAVAAQNVQSCFLDAAMAACPQLKVNGRLQSRLSSPIIKGQNAIQLLGAVFMSLVLLDVGQSSCTYLEILKHYYLAQSAASQNEFKTATVQLAVVDDMIAHPFPLSYVGPRFFSQGMAAAGLLATRADLLCALGRKHEAIASVRSAIAASPDNFRLYLQLARLLDENGQSASSSQQISKAIEIHRDALLPRLYLIAASRGSKAQARAAYKQAMEDFSTSSFGTQPVWPPGANTFLHDVFYSQDITFVLDRLLGVPLKPACAGGQR